jgi:hypothetical protein
MVGRQTIIDLNNDRGNSARNAAPLRGRGGQRGAHKQSQASPSVPWTSTRTIAYAFMTFTAADLYEGWRDQGSKAGEVNSFVAA